MNRIALIVPVYRDTAAVASLLERVESWPRRPDETILVAADPEPALREVCDRHRARLLETGANRGAQLDLGARSAAADTLWFLHADAAPAEGSIEAIAAARDEGAEGGCFRFAFQGPATATKSLLTWLTNLRVALGGVAYGDQGIFAARDAYLACGGFAPQPLFEEVPLVRALRRRGRFLRLRLALPAATRRWERDGWWRRALGNRWLALCYILGVPAARLAGRYQRRGTRSPGAHRI